MRSDRGTGRQEKTARKTPSKVKDGSPHKKLLEDREQNKPEGLISARLI